MSCDNVECITLVIMNKLLHYINVGFQNDGVGVIWQCGSRMILSYNNHRHGIWQYRNTIRSWWRDIFQCMGYMTFDVSYNNTICVINVFYQRWYHVIISASYDRVDVPYIMFMWYDTDGESYDNVTVLNSNVGMSWQRRCVIWQYSGVIQQCLSVIRRCFSVIWVFLCYMTVFYYVMTVSYDSAGVS